MILNMNGHFKVIYINEIDEIEPIPHWWEKNGVLYWPPTNRLVRQLQSNADSKPDPNTWTKYSCEVKENHILLYMHASAAADQLCEITSASSASREFSAEEEEKSNDCRRQLPPIKKKVLAVQSEYDFNAGTSLKKSVSRGLFANQKPSVQQMKLDEVDLKAVHLLSVSAFETPSVRKLVTNKAKKVKGDLKPPTSPIHEDFDETIRNPSPDEGPSSRNSVLNKLANIEGQLSHLLAFMSAWQEKAENLFSGFSARLDKLEDILKKSEIESVPTEDKIGLFPLSSSQEVHKLDRDLVDDLYKKKVYSHLRRIVGNAMPWKQASYRLCNVLFTKKVLTLFSWTGVSRSTSKDAFNKLANILEVFYKVIYKADNTFTFPQRDAFFRDGILKHSNTRLRTKKAINQATKSEEEQVVVEDQIENNQENKILFRSDEEDSNTKEVIVVREANDGNEILYDFDGLVRPRVLQ